MPAPKRRWEEVLAQVEEDVRRTEALLAEAGEDRSPTRAALGTAWAVRSGGPVIAPAETMLPAHADPALPRAAEMPPVPPELLDRIVTLRTRIDALRCELEAEMAAWRATLPLLDVPRARLRAAAPVRPPVPRFVDREL